MNDDEHPRRRAGHAAPHRARGRAGRAARRPCRCATRSTSTRWTGSTSSSALHERFGVDIPEADYARLVTLDTIVAYLAHRLAA